MFQKFYSKIKPKKSVTEQQQLQQQNNDSSNINNNNDKIRQTTTTTIKTPPSPPSTVNNINNSSNNSNNTIIIPVIGNDSSSECETKPITTVIKLNSPKKTTTTVPQPAPSLPQTTDYPSTRTRLLRHLSSGTNSPTTPSSSLSSVLSQPPNQPLLYHNNNNDVNIQSCCHCQCGAAIVGSQLSVKNLPQFNPRRQSWACYTNRSNNSNNINSNISPQTSPYSQYLHPPSPYHRNSIGNNHYKRLTSQQHNKIINNSTVPPSNDSNTESLYTQNPYESNLMKFKSTKLGSSAPNLSSSLKELTISRKNSANRRSIFHQKLNNHVNTVVAAAASANISPSPSTTISLGLNLNHSCSSSPLDCSNSHSNSPKHQQHRKEQLTLQHTQSLPQSQQQQQHSQAQLSPNQLNKPQFDTRRWSSSDYGSNSPTSQHNPSNTGGTNTTATTSRQNSNNTAASISTATSKYGYDSGQSSQYSSHEKLLHQQQQHQHLNLRPTSFSPIETPHNHQQHHSSVGSGSDLCFHDRCSRLCSLNDSISLDESAGSDNSHLSPAQSQQQQQQAQPQNPQQHNHRLSFYQRARARSLSCSPVKMYNDADVMTFQNDKFREKFLKAQKQMEENLEKFIQIQQKLDFLINKKSIDEETSNFQTIVETTSPSATNVNSPIDLDIKEYVQIQTDAAAHFVYNQIIELAKSCFDKSKESQLTCAYFDEITNSLEKLLHEARDKCNHELNSLQYLHKLVKKFLLIISRVARLLECLEFDPIEFCELLNAAELQARLFVKTDIPKYIISKLGLNRDPLEEFSINANANEDSTAGVGVNAGALDSLSSSTASSSIASTPLAIGTGEQTPRKRPTEDDFEELKLISNGAYGAVHLVRHRLSNERYAMKKIKKQNLILRNQVQQVFTERDIMTFTDNPFVVALICTFETKKYLCMVMEYVEGGDVATLIKNMGPLPLDMARVYFAETTLAVEYLHSYGIIHRDLKPDNLLITSMGHIKLTDFGLSKVGLMNLTTNFYEGDYGRKDQYCKEFNDKQVCGTPQYLAPEVILRQGYGKAVDWWSMGIILYEFLTSVTPFNGNTPEELFANVINGEILWPDSDDELIFIPDEGKNLIACLLKHDPLERLGAGGALEVKEHPFHQTVDWDNLLRIKAEFIPQLDGPDDTSYFDTRSERYNHEIDASSMSINASNQNLTVETLMDDTATSTTLDCEKLNNKKLTRGHKKTNSNDTDIDDDTESELFLSFSSCSSKYKLNTLAQSIEKPPLKTPTPPPTSIESTAEVKEQVLPATTTTTTTTTTIDVTTPTETTPPALIIKNESTSSNESLDSQKNTGASTTANNSDSDVFSNNRQDNLDDNELLKSLAAITTTDSPQLTVETTAAAAPISNNSSVSNSSNTTIIMPQQITNKNHNGKRFSRYSKSNDDKVFSNKHQQQNQYFKQPQPLSQQQQQQYSASTSLPTSNASAVSIQQQQQQQQKQIRSSKPHLSSASFNCKRSENNYRFPNSFSYSKLSHLTVPGNELNKQAAATGAGSGSNSGSNMKLLSNTSLNRMSPAGTPTHSNRSSLLLTPSSMPTYRDPSPIRDLIKETKRKAPIIIKRGPRGYGFTLRAIKVYYGDSDSYTIQHLVIQVDENGPAYEAGLRAQDLITHVNEKCVCGLLHHEIIRSILSGRNSLQLRTIQLNETSIKTGGRKRSPSKSKLSRPSTLNTSSSYALNRYKRSSLIEPQQQQSNLVSSPSQQQQQQQQQPLAPPPPPLQQTQPEKKKKASLFRKLSERRAQRYEQLQQQQQQQQHQQQQQQQQLSSSGVNLSSSNNSNSMQFMTLQNDLLNKRNNLMSNSDPRLCKYQQNDQLQTSINLTLNRHLMQTQQQQQQSRSPFDSSTYASSSSSPGSSVPNSPAIGGLSNARPRSLLVINNNNNNNPVGSTGFLANTSPEPMLTFIGFNNQGCSSMVGGNTTAGLSSSSSSLSSSPLNLSSNAATIYSNVNQQILQPIFQQQQQQRGSPLSPYPPPPPTQVPQGAFIFTNPTTFQRSWSTSGASMVTNNGITQILHQPSPQSSCCSSCASSCSSLNSNQTQQQQQQQQLHLSPSPLAISDAMTISYGNPNSTQTTIFAPSIGLAAATIASATGAMYNNNNNQITRPKFIISSNSQPTNQQQYQQQQQFMNELWQQQQQQQQQHHHHHHNLHNYPEHSTNNNQQQQQ